MSSAVPPELEAREWLQRHTHCRDLLDAFTKAIADILRFQLYAGKRGVQRRIPMVREMVAMIVSVCATKDDPIPILVIDLHMRAAARVTARYMRPHAMTRGIIRSLQEMEIIVCRDEKCWPSAKTYAFIDVFDKFYEAHRRYRENVDWERLVKDSWEILENNLYSFKQREVDQL